MQMCIGVYLHGFLSSGKSEKGQWLTQQIADENKVVQPPLFTEFITVTYPIKSVQDSVHEIEKIIAQYPKKQNKIILLGSSMGGYYAQYLGQKYQLPYIMINPALNPVPVFVENQGEHINPSTGEMVKIDKNYIADLQRYDVCTLKQTVPALLLIDKDDEVIDVAFAIQRYQPLANRDKTDSCFETVIYSGGDHRFIHMEDAWPKIKAFIQKIPE
ncbi:MAG: YqiA/YcfP family alpha/beta fold hydrolase [Thiomicrorhabdus sp.]|nr:YqiA/YcfP family alpha/beta fold hydrolase [Thiomicrorhabdus sp.]